MQQTGTGHGKPQRRRGGGHKNQTDFIMPTDRNIFGACEVIGNVDIGNDTEWSAQEQK